MNFAVKVTCAMTLSMMSVGCATVPDGAPSEFQNARTEIDAMREADAERLTPVTAERAESTFAASLEMLEAAETSEDPAASRAAAAAKAKEAATLASSALELNRNIKAWDQSVENYAHLTKTNAAIADLRKELERTSQWMAEASAPFGRDSWTKPVAFFETGHASISKASGSTLRELATLMKQYPRISVKLVGAADERGSETFNAALAGRRAAAVAAKLESLGVHPSRIVISSTGESLALGDVSKEEEMQVDRRVDATLFTPKTTAAK